MPTEQETAQVREGNATAGSIETNARTARTARLRAGDCDRHGLSVHGGHGHHDSLGFAGDRAVADIRPSAIRQATRNASLPSRVAATDLRSHAGLPQSLTPILMMPPRLDLAGPGS